MILLWKLETSNFVKMILVGMGSPLVFRTTPLSNQGRCLEQSGPRRWDTAKAARDFKLFAAKFLGISRIFLF